MKSTQPSSTRSKPTQQLPNFTPSYGVDSRHFKALAKNKYWFYVEYVHSGLYHHGRHTRYVCDKIEALIEGRSEKKKLMLWMPPRHSKSMTVTETLPSYFIGKNPDKSVIAVSYADALAQKFGRLNKQKIENFGQDLFDVELDPQRSANGNWGIKGHRGGMRATGIGGSLTGEGADLLIVDDPFKNREEANSQVIRNKVWEEWQNTLLTRLQPDGVVIVINTRWHEDDLCGRILRDPEEAAQWEIISLPAICENPETDPLGRSYGEALNPERGFDEKWCENKKREVGSVAWAALYQQRPAPSDGNIFNRKWWRYYKELPDDIEEKVQSWDCAFKDNKDSDFVAGHVWGKAGARYYLIDRIKDRMNVKATMDAIRMMTAKHPDAYAKLVEDKANGTAVIQMLSDEIDGIIPVNPEGGKVARANAVSPIVEAGNVYLPDPSIAPWIMDFVNEAAAFPNGANDDDVDAFTQAINRLRGGKEPNVRSL